MSRNDSKKSLVPTRFDFDVNVESIRPWTPTPIPLVIMWQRGDRRAGLSHVLFSVPDENLIESNSFCVPVEQSFKIPATLYQDTSAGTQRAYQRKTVVFTLYEASSVKSNVPRGEPLARALLDLAEFADLAGVNSHSLTLSLNPNLPSIDPAPRLHLSLCFTGKKYPPGFKKSPKTTADLFSGSEVVPRPNLSQSSLAEFGHSRQSTMDMDEDTNTESSFAMAEDSSVDFGAGDFHSRDPSPGYSQLSYRENTHSDPAPLPQSLSNPNIASWQQGRGHQNENPAEAQPTFVRSSTDSHITLGAGEGAGQGGDGLSNVEGGGVWGWGERRRSFNDRLSRLRMDRGGVGDEEGGIPVVMPSGNGGIVSQPSFGTSFGLASPEGTSPYVEGPRGGGGGYLVPPGMGGGYARGRAWVEHEKVRREKAILEEMAGDVARALEKAAEVHQRARDVERAHQSLPGALADCALAELAVLATAPRHGGSEHHMYRSARRLWRAYRHSRDWATDRARTTAVARTALRSLVLGALAAGNDVSRLTFLWSNAVVLREIISADLGLGVEFARAESQAEEEEEQMEEYAEEESVQAAMEDGREVEEAADEFEEMEEGEEQREAVSEKGDRDGSVQDVAFRRSLTAPVERIGTEWEDSEGAGPRLGPCLTMQVKGDRNRGRMRQGVSRSSRGSMGEAGKFADAAEGGWWIKELIKLEAWLHSKVLHVLWSTVFLPLMKPLPESEASKGQQKSTGTELWVSALETACEQLCPVRAKRSRCPCLMPLGKQVLEQCLARLDVALFNSLLRGPQGSQNQSPEDPISDPSALLFLPGPLTFSHGLGIKIALSSFTDVAQRFASAPHRPVVYEPLPAENAAPSAIWNLLAKTEGTEGGDAGDCGSELRDPPEHSWDPSSEPFPFLRALGDLLMVPKALLSDVTVRREVCGILPLGLVKRAIYLFKPEGATSPGTGTGSGTGPADDYVSPALMAAINSQLKAQAKLKGEKISECSTAPSPKIVYRRPSSGQVQAMIEGTERSLLDKGSDSDEELNEVEEPMGLLKERFQFGADISELVGRSARPRIVHKGERRVGFELLRHAWDEGQ